MQRKRAVAAAGAISMSLLSLAVAVGANFGALGFSSTSATAAQPSAVVASLPTQAVSPTSAKITTATPASNPTHETHQKERGSDD